ncbi:MAG: YbdD/YjiX family protein [Betaproteobacteria bacterium]
MKFLKTIWSYLREASGDDAYERYLAHHAITHKDATPMSRSEYFTHRQTEKWSGIKRCC